MVEALHARTRGAKFNSYQKFLLPPKPATHPTMIHLSDHAECRIEDNVLHVTLNGGEFRALATALPPLHFHGEGRIVVRDCRLGSEGQSFQNISDLL